MRSNTGAEQTQESSKCTSHHKAHHSSERAALKDPRHNELLPGLDSGQAGRLGHYDVGVGSYLAAHQVPGDRLKLGGSEGDTVAGAGHCGHFVYTVLNKGDEKSVCHDFLHQVAWFGNLSHGILICHKLKFLKK